MWINEDEIIPYFESFINEDLTIEDVQDFCHTKIEITPEEIQAWLTEEAQRSGANMEDKEERIKYTLNENDYYVYTKSFEIYTEKCYRFCHILKMLAGYGVKSEDLLKMLDIQIKNGKVLKNDVLRVVKPLIKNYVLACKMKEKAENPATYLEKVYLKTSKKELRDYLPDTSVINRRNKVSEESIALTSKQKQEWDEEFKKRLKQASQECRSL